MNRRVLVLLGLVALAAIPTLAALWLAGSTADDEEAILVFAPSSFAPIQAELDAGLSDDGIGPVEWVFAGSQSLVAQLVDGAPADALVTADLETFEAAQTAGATWPTERTLALNVLVLAVADENPGEVAGLADLADPDLLVGMCATEVPCGRLAAEATAALGTTIAPDTQETSARALTAKLVAGEIDAGLIYRSDAQAAGLSVIPVDGLDTFANEYWGTGNDRGAAVVNWLAGESGQLILADAGWGR